METRDGNCQGNLPLKKDGAWDPYCSGLPEITHEILDLTLFSNMATIGYTVFQQEQTIKNGEPMHVPSPSRRFDATGA